LSALLWFQRYLALVRPEMSIVQLLIVLRRERNRQEMISNKETASQ
jgi:hypothetical protein